MGGRHRKEAVTRCALCFSDADPYQRGHAHPALWVSRRIQAFSFQKSLRLLPPRTHIHRPGKRSPTFLAGSQGLQGEGTDPGALRREAGPEEQSHSTMPRALCPRWSGTLGGVNCGRCIGGTGLVIVSLELNFGSRPWLVWGPRPPMPPATVPALAGCPVIHSRMTVFMSQPPGGQGVNTVPGQEPWSAAWTQGSRTEAGRRGDWNRPREVRGSGGWHWGGDMHGPEDRVKEEPRLSL